LQNPDILPHVRLKYLQSIPLLPAPENSNLTQYPTVWGHITFEELYDKTYRYACKILANDIRLNSTDRDDCLQVGYLKLWKRLQTEPDVLDGKPIAWIGRFVQFAALHQGQRDYKYDKRNTQYNPDFKLHQRPDKTPIDTRIDLQAAIVSTANIALEQDDDNLQERNLWALYGLTMLQESANKTAKHFGIHHTPMTRAYNRVREMLQRELYNYAPSEPTKFRNERRYEQTTFQDMDEIYAVNIDISPERFEQLRLHLIAENPDTLERDLIALEGIRLGQSSRHVARYQGVNKAAMHRAYQRVHLLLAAQVDPTVTPRRLQKTKLEEFHYHPEQMPIIREVANELLDDDNANILMIALYAHLCNLPTRATARNFGLTESRLRRYRHRVQERFLN
jgi:hypothetical protein